MSEHEAPPITTLEELKAAIEDSIMRMLASQPKVPADTDPLGTKLMREAVDKALESQIGQDLAQLTVTCEVDETDPRHVTFNVTGPPEIMSRICFGRCEDFASHVDVDVKIKE